MPTKTVAQPSVAGPMPAQLDVVAGLLNTIDHATQRDELATTDGVARWLTRRRLAPTMQIDQGERRQLIEVREALAQLVAANAGTAVDRRAVTVLNEAARRVRLGVRIHPDDGYRLIAEGPGIDRPIGEILVRVMSAMTAGNWHRLKLCANPECGRAFYDASRNRSGRWHSMATCGNRMKGRAYRRRRSVGVAEQSDRAA